MGRYFGRQPRYSQEEAEAQAKAALEAAVNKGRPPEEEWKALGSRMGEINRELATRPPVDLPSPPSRPAASEKGNTRNTGRPRAISEILRPPPPPPPAPAPEAAPPRRPKRSTAPTPPPAARAPRAAPPAPAKRAPAAPAKRAKLPPEDRPAPAKRATRASAPAPAPPVKRSARATEKRAPAAAKRQAAKKRPE